MVSDTNSHISRPVSNVVARARQIFETRLSETLVRYNGSEKLSRVAVERSTIEIMEVITSDTFHNLVGETSRDGPSESAYDEISKVILAVLDDFGRDLVGLASRLSGAAKSPVRVSDLLGSYREMRSEVESKLVLSRQEFLAGRLSSSDPSKRAVNRGGKPLAKHWDEVWAQIAFQLWNGDLKPESQADIKRAMFAWFNAREIEVGDTAVTQRARQLWRLLDPIGS